MCYKHIDVSMSTLGGCGAPGAAEVAANAMPGRGQYDRTQTAPERRREQRATLLTSAARVFAGCGYASASVEAIIQDAGMSRRTFYGHFRDLRAVLLELHDQSARFAVAFVRQAVEAAPGPVEAIDAGIRAFLELSAKNADFARVLFYEIRASGDDKRRESLEDAFADLMIGALRAAHARGDITIAPDRLAVIGLVGAIETTAMRLVEHGREARLRDAAPTLLRMTLNTFR